MPDVTRRKGNLKEERQQIATPCTARQHNVRWNAGKPASETLIRGDGAGPDESNANRACDMVLGFTAARGPVP
jgi:hypothetical protein